MTDQFQAQTPTGSEISPLVEIERSALEVANDRNISISDDLGDGPLRSIVAELVEQWRADYRRGIRPVDLAEPQAIVDRAMSNLTGYGPLASLLDDDDVWEIMLNGPEDSLLDAWGADEITDAEVASYWRRLIAANEDRLVDPGNPDLLLPGQELVLPPVPAQTIDIAAPSADSSATNQS